MSLSVKCLTTHENIKIKMQFCMKIIERIYNIDNMEYKKERYTFDNMKMQNFYLKSHTNEAEK